MWITRFFKYCCSFFCCCCCSVYLFIDDVAVVVVIIINIIVVGVGVTLIKKTVIYRRQAISSINIKDLSCFETSGVRIHEDLIIMDSVETSEAVIGHL